MIRIACLWIVAASAMAGSVSAREAAVETLDGRRITGELTAWNDRGVTLQTGEGETHFAAEEVLDVGFPVPVDASESSSAETPVIVVRLHDGTILPASAANVADRKARLVTRLAAEPVEIPTSQIQLMELAPRNEAAERVWAELQRKELPGDVLLIKKKDGASVDYLAGVVGDVTDDEVEFEWEGDRIPVKRSKVAAIAFYRGAGAAESPPTCRVKLTDGAVIAAMALRMAGDEVELTTSGELRLRASLDELVSADYSLGKLAYLGDERPLNYRWTPLVGLPPGAEAIAAYGEPRFNRSFSGGPIRLLKPGGASNAAVAPQVEEFARGIALRSRTEIAYDVPAGMTRFAALAGIAPPCAAEGRVHLALYGDRELLWEGAIVGGDEPQDLNLDLGGARRLRIVVDYGENLDYGDQLHLPLARFVK